MTRVSLLILWSILAIQNVKAQTTTSPNTTLYPTESAVVTGSSTVLNCTNSGGATGVTWFFYPVPGSQPVTIATNCAVQQAYTSRYSTTIDNAASLCSLIVINASASEAGQYQCLGSALSLQGYLTVVDQPTGKQNQSDFITAGQSFFVWCNVSYYYYASSTSAPIPALRWVSSINYIPVTNSTGTDPSTAIKISVPENTAIVPSVTCEVYFGGNVQFSTTATWSSIAFNVSYCPIVYLTSNNTDPVYYVGDVMNCSAVAYPPVDMIYLTVNDTLYYSGNTSQYYPLTYGTHNINCTAVNYLFGGNDGFCESSEISVIEVVSKDENDGSQGWSTGAIVGTVFGCICAVVAGVVVIVVSVRFCKKSKCSDSNKEGSTTTGSQNGLNENGEENSQPMTVLNQGSHYQRGQSPTSIEPQLQQPDVTQHPSIMTQPLPASYRPFAPTENNQTESGSPVYAVLARPAPSVTATVDNRADNNVYAPVKSA